MENYIVSARKYRPDTFSTVVAQASLTTTLMNAIGSGKLAHAYLFCGPRGVGKTTCARIFAKTINCLNPTPRGESCNECESCKSFNEQRSYSIYELDAASNNTVDDIRSLNEQVRIPPQVGKYKVYIIDEVHMLSQSAFNAFLKTLEEPPRHAIFILATTEKHKIIPTILSRCQIYDFSRIEVADIVNHLKNIGKSEGIRAEDEALRIIAQKSDGCMRDALSLFDQMISFTQGELTYTKVIESLNILDYEYFFRFTDHFLQNEIPKTLLLFNEILSKGFDGQIFIGSLASHIRDLMVASDQATIILFEGSNDLRERYRKQATQCKRDFLFKALKLCNNCDMNYRSSRNKRLLIELTLIELSQLTDNPSLVDEASGLGPKKLKPIFTHNNETAAGNNTTANQQTTAPNLNRESREETETKQPTQSPITQEPKNREVKADSPKIQPTAPNPFGGMFSSTLRQFQSQDKQSPENVANQKTEKQSTKSETKKIEFNHENLLNAWLTFATELPASDVALSGRMKIMVPQLAGNNSFEISVDNTHVKELFENESKRIEMYLGKTLECDFIKMKITINNTTVQRRVYDRGEQYKLLKEKNPIIETLRNKLNLELY